MTIKKWMYLFRTTWLIGVFTALVVAFVQEIRDGVHYGESWYVELFYSVLAKVWAGTLFSVVASLGFFAFMIFNNLLLGVFKNSRLYQSVLWLLLLFAFFDVVFLRYYFFADREETMVDYVYFPLFVLVVGIAVAWWKSKVTSFKAFVSTVFFMFTFTFIEMIPALQANNGQAIGYMAITLLMCNTWQIMKLHQLLR